MKTEEREDGGRIGEGETLAFSPVFLDYSFTGSLFQCLVYYSLYSYPDASYDCIFFVIGDHS